MSHEERGPSEWKGERATMFALIIATAVLAIAFLATTIWRP
jgi:hypothetical protein